MRRSVILVLPALAIGVLLGTALIGTAGGARSAAVSDKALFATLTGAAEIGNDGQRNAGDRDGKGAASILITGNRVCFGIQVNGIARPMAAHIHQARAGVNGPIVVNLRPPSAGSNGASAGCTTAAASLRNAIKRTPSGFYVNVHTGAFPSGAVRGQLR